MKQRFSKRTRLVSALLTLAMVFTFLPFSAFAANTASTGIAFNSPDFKLNFPDEEFRHFLIDHCDTNNDGKLDVDIKNMTIPTSYAIKSLEGIRFFEDLEKLDCHGIGLTTLNVGKNFKLKELDCSGNQLKEYYPILSSGLKKLNCSNNKLTYMNLGILSGLNLEEVDCSNNKITNIVMDSVGELVKFDCSNNDLMTLDVSQCLKLEELNCSGNQLMELDVGHQPQLTQLNCSNNKLTELNVKQNGGLTSLICNDNQLTTLNLSQNHSLSNLNCARNRLACLDVTGISGTIIADGNRCPIAVRTDGTFDLTTLPGFDVSKATNWNGGSVPGSGTILTVEDGKNEVSYQYDCGKGVKPTFIFETSLPINEKNFPDPNFRNYIKTYKAGGRDVLTVEERSKVEIININKKDISDLKGVEAFPNLTELDCGNNSIQNLDLRQNPKLKKLICNTNQLTQLDLSKNPDIYYLNCSENQLEQLDVSHLKDLENLDCSHNDLEQLDVKNSKFLRALYCSWNRLTELDADVSHKFQLERVECQNNQLTSLILGENKLLKKLNCANNQLTQLNLNNMNSLEELKCSNNQLTALDVSSSPDLTKLVLKNNHLTSLNLDNNPNLNFTYTDIHHSDFNNVYTVTLNPDRTFDLNTLPGDFDISRVTGWEHGKANGNILTVDEGTNVVYYAYKCRSDIMEVSFKLDVTGTGGSTGGGSTGGGSTGGGSTGGGSTGGGSTGGGSTGGGSTGGDSTIPPEAGKYQLTVTDGVATVNGITRDVLNVKPGDTVTLTADTTKFPENEEFGWWEITPYGSVSNTLTGQYQRTATFTMPNENVSARAMSKSAGVSTGGDDGGGGGGAAILLVGGAAVAGLVGYGVYSYVSEQQLKALLPEGVAMPENRAQTALLLWNTAGRPEPAEAPAFKDVADPDTAKAAQWCVEHGLMDRKLGGRFAPDNSDPAYKTLNAYQQLVG